MGHYLSEMQDDDNGNKSSYNLNRERDILKKGWKRVPASISLGSRYDTIVINGVSFVSPSSFCKLQKDMEGFIN